MTKATAFAALLLAQVATGAMAATENELDVGCRELLAGQEGDAMAKIAASIALHADDPALLINKDIALAREGRFDAARAAFKTAMASKERFQLETVAGEWIDSRKLAGQGLALLDKGEFARYYALTMR